MNIFRSMGLIIFFIFLTVGLYAAVADFTGNDYLKLDPTGLLQRGKEALFKNVPSFQRPARFKFAVISDTHSDTEETAKAIIKAKSLGAQLIVSTGDLTQVGAIDELAAQKRLFDESGLEYYVIPGDHDLYNSGGTGNFRKMFGYTNQSFVKNDVHFLMLDAQDSTKGIGEAQLKWALQELKTKKAAIHFVFMHLPPYHPSSTRTIYQKAQKDGEINQTAKDEADALLKGMVAAGATDLFSGDHHLSNRYQEPTSKMWINIVGAVTRERNLQTSRFDMVEVYDDNTFAINDTEVDK